jgi:hypothetical protein
MVHVHSQLMRPSCLWAETNERETSKPFEDFVEGGRVSGISPFRADHHSFAISVTDADVCFDVIAIERDFAPGDGSIFLFDGPFFELPAQMVMNGVVLGDDKNATGITVESMDDSRSKLPRDIAQLVEMKLQGSRQGSEVIAPSWVDDHVRSLVDHDQRIVIIKDIQGDIFGGKCSIGRFRKVKLDAIIDAQPTRHFDGKSIDQDAVVLQHSLKGGSAEIGVQTDEIVIDAPSMRAGLDDHLDRFSGYFRSDFFRLLKFRFSLEFVVAHRYRISVGRFVSASESICRIKVQEARHAVVSGLPCPNINSCVCSRD